MVVTFTTFRIFVANAAQQVNVVCGVRTAIAAGFDMGEFGFDNFAVIVCTDLSASPTSVQAIGQKLALPVNCRFPSEVDPVGPVK